MSIFYDYLLLKLAMRCNIACSYCYWFRDDDVYKKPKRLTKEAESAVLLRLTSYLKRHKLEKFEIIFHGGEPLLFGKKRFDDLCRQLRDIEKSTRTELQFSITTNALLIDDEWMQLFKKYKLNIGVSLDGNQAVNDKNRIDFKGQGTYQRVKKSIKYLQACGLEPSILAVCQPDYNNVVELCRCFVDELQVKQFDFLIPDITYHDEIKSISNFYKTLFDIWYDKYSKEDIFITIIESIVRGSLGFRSLNNAIGLTPVKTITILTDGTIEPLDYLRVVENKLTESPYHVFEHELDALQQHPIWQECYHASLNLHEKCNQCKFKFACGGGPLQTRWSNTHRFNNPSVYCEDLFNIFEHASTRISNDLYIENAGM